MKITIAALALIAAGLFGTAAVAAPISPAHGASTTPKLTQSVHWRHHRCHRRWGHRCRRGGYAYYGGPSIFLGFGGGGRHHFRGYRHGGGHMHHGGGMMMRRHH